MFNLRHRQLCAGRSREAFKYYRLIFKIIVQDCNEIGHVFGKENNDLLFVDVITEQCKYCGYFKWPIGETDITPVFETEVSGSNPELASISTVDKLDKNK